MPTYTLKFNDLNIQTEIRINLEHGAVHLTVDKTEVKIPLETFYKIVKKFPVLLDGGFT